MRFLSLLLLLVLTPVCAFAGSKAQPRAAYKGAIVMEAQEGTGTIKDRGVLTTHLRSDGRHREKLYVDGGPSSTKTVGHLRMQGKDVFRHAEEKDG